MTRFWAACLLMVNLCLAAVLAWLWFDKEGGIKNSHWLAPSAVVPAIPALPNNLLVPEHVDNSRALSLLERPLFSPSRRPPPPPTPSPTPSPTPAPLPPDPLDTTSVFGILGTKDNAILMVRVDGRVRNLKIKDTIGPWALEAVQGQVAVFVKDKEKRTLMLQPAKLNAVPASAPIIVPAQPQGQSAQRPIPGPISRGAMEEEERERMRAINNIRIKAGLPPLGTN